MKLYSHSPSITSIAPGVRKKKSKKHITLSTLSNFRLYKAWESSCYFPEEHWQEKKKTCTCLTHWIIKFYLQTFWIAFFFTTVQQLVDKKLSNCVPMQCFTDNHLSKKFCHKCKMHWAECVWNSCLDQWGGWNPITDGLMHINESPLLCLFVSQFVLISFVHFGGLFWNNLKHFKIVLCHNR